MLSLSPASRILIVNGEEAACAAMAAQLEPTDFEVKFAIDSSEALRRVVDFSPDVMLVDMLPANRGVELCRRLKQDPSYQHIPIILTADSQEIIDTEEKAGDDFLPWPVAGVELRSRIRSMLKLKHRHDRLLEALGQQDDLINIIVHDMRAPLTAILIYSELLARNDSPRANGELAEQIEESAQRLKELTDDLMSLSEMEHGHVLSKPLDLELHPWLADIAHKFRALARKRGVELESTIEPEACRSIHADAKLLERTLSSLLGNAIKHSHREDRIVLRAQLQPARKASSRSCVRIEISHPGPPISPEDCELLFDKLSIGELKRRGVSQAGVALAFCRRVVEEHGGEIFATSSGQLRDARTTYAIEIPQGHCAA